MASHQWPQPYHVASQEHERPASSHHEDSHQDSHSIEHTSAEAHQQDHPETSNQNTSHPAPIPIMSMVPQYVRGEEHVSTFVPPLPHSAPITFPPPLSHETYQTPLAHHQPPHEGGNDEPQIQTSDGGHIHQPQPMTPIPSFVESFQPPRSPSPEVPIFEAPQSEWNPER